MSERKRIGLTAGCPAGIGPEVLVRALAETPVDAELVWFSGEAALQRGMDAAGVDVRSRLRLPPMSRAYVQGAPGAPSDDDLALQRDALVQACDAARRGELDALVTGPVRKRALVIDGVAFPGQTEVVAARVPSQSGEPLMVFAGGPFVMGLCTVHVALRDVSAHITALRVDRCLALLADAARRIAGDAAPSVVVLGVNPHAGEGGLFGREEIDVVAPAVARAREGGLDVRGPVPADGFFADIARGVAPPTAVLAMHHDQALAPYKLLVGGEGINVTWGAGVVRTSPDHGTADALSGKGKASHLSMLRALELAQHLIR